MQARLESEPMEVLYSVTCHFFRTIEGKGARLFRSRAVSWRGSSQMNHDHQKAWTQERIAYFVSTLEGSRAGQH